ncbi:MAG: hypothetical protein FWD15_02695 [Alphaproteobacteria bacterium]|nr:hypothetical protein [Alphaproteobacteria bacterium]
MTKVKKHYIVIFTGIILITLGLLLRSNFVKKSQNTRAVKQTELVKAGTAPAKTATKSATKPVAKPKITLRPKDNDIKYHRAQKVHTPKVYNLPTNATGLNFTYDNVRVPPAPKQAKPKVATGTAQTGTLAARAAARRAAQDDCIGNIDKCEAQNIRSARANKAMTAIKADANTRKIDGDFVLTRENVGQFKQNTLVRGNLIIRGFDRFEVPCGLSVDGNVIVENSRAVRFAGRNVISGNILVRRGSSVAALPADSLLAGRVVI